MAKEIIQTNFTKGINRDVPPRFQPEGTYRHALNKKKASESFLTGGLVNELQNKYAASISGKIVGFYRLEERNSTLFFHTNGASIISIYNHDTDEVKEIVKDSDFGCNWGFQDCKWIGYGHSDSKSIAPCNELIIYWSSDLTYYKANIDELQDENRRRSISLQEVPCDYFKLMKCGSGPRVKLRANRGGGKDLVPGQYYAVARSIDESGNETNWGPIEGPVYIGSKYNKFTDHSHQSVQIQAKGLNKDFSRIQIAVIPPIGSVAEDVAYVIYDGSYNTNGVTAEYYAQAQHKFAVPLSEILTKDIKFLRGENLIADDSKLHLYRTLQEFNPKVQEWAQKIKISAIAYAVPQSQAYKWKSFKPDEVHAFGAEWMYCDQTFTATGHIPGVQGGGNELTCGVCDLPPGHTSNNASVAEIYNTIEGALETLCMTGGQRTTIHEKYDPTTSCTTEDPITPRSENQSDCVDFGADQKASEDHIENIQNTPDTISDCIDCDQAATTNDLNESKGFLVNSVEHYTDLFKTDKEATDTCQTGAHDTLPDAAATLYDEAIVKAAQDEEVSYRTIVTHSGGKNATVTSMGGASSAQSSATIMQRSGKGDDCVTEDVEPIVLAKYNMGGWESTFPYPKTLDCDGKPLYGDLAGLPIRHHKFPDSSLVPLFYSFQAGVESRFDPANIPGKDTYVVMLGIQVENVYIPDFEKGEIPKPLDKNQPWRIVMAKREKHNQSVLYTGYFINTFKGKIGNKEYAVPRHAANSYANVDRTINTTTGSHLGEDWTEPLYTFHSPDIIGADFINGDYVKIDARLSGNGMVYGQYAEGKAVKDEDPRLDRRGVRSALNFTEWETVKFQTCLKGAEFAEFNSNLQNPEGISRPLINKYREGCIFLETEDLLPNVGDGGKDKSFNVGGLDHEYQTRGQVLYGSIKRFNSQQYGNVESLQYVDIGVIGRNGETSTRALTGDCFVQKWSDKRSSYISDKVGNFLNVDYAETATDTFLGPAGSAGLDRSICEPPNRRGYRWRDFLGTYNRLELPQNGDKKDPKNMANGHPTLSSSEIWGDVNAVGGAIPAQTDLFYPRTLNHLNHLIVVSDVNLHYRSTSAPATREIFYEERQGVDLDSSINHVDPEDAWLNDWYNEQKQPTKKQMAKKAMIRFAVVFGGPIIIAGLIAAASTPLGLGTSMLVGLPFFGALWKMLVYNILTSKKLDSMLGIPLCKNDKDGAQSEDNTKGLKDNWTAYNYGFSAVNDLNFFIGMPAIYNTCICKTFTNVIYSSNRQIDTSPYDAWSNFQALSYSAIAGDSGQLQKLFVWGDGLYAQTTDGIFQLQRKEISAGSNTAQNLLGSNAFAASPVRVLNGAMEGFGGTVDPNSAITCRYGHVSMDYEAKEITLFSSQFESLVSSKSGLYHYWKDNFSFCNDGCRDQMSPEGTHYTFGYDPEYELIMITKHDGGAGHTFSYDLASKMFISEHSFVPDFYFWDRNKLFSVKDGEIFRQNMVGAYSTYFGKKYSSSVDIAVHAGDSKTFTYEHSTLDTEVATLGGNGLPELNDREETYNYLTAWNQWQQTGRLPIINEDQDDAFGSTKDKDQVTISRRELGEWKLNNFLSNELDRNIPVVTIEPCGGVEQPNLDNIDPNPRDQKAKMFKGKYLIQRLEFNKNDRQIILFGTNTHVTQSDEK